MFLYFHLSVSLVTVFQASKFDRVGGFMFQTADEWQSVFIIASSVHFVGITFYALFASGELQPWAQDDDEIEPPPQQQVTLN